MVVAEVLIDESVDDEDDVTILHGRNLVLKLLQSKDEKRLLVEPEVKQFLSSADIFDKARRKAVDKLIETEFQAGIRLVRGPKERLRFMQLISERRADQRTLQEVEPTIRELRKLPTLEQKAKNKIGKEINLLESAVLVRCPKCRMPLDLKRGLDTAVYVRNWGPVLFRSPEFYGLKGELIEPTKCDFCGHVVNKEDAKRSHLHTVKENIRYLWENHLWLSASFSEILESLGWQTWPRVRVLGSTGRLHSIAILAVKEGRVLTCDFRSGELLGRLDVEEFLAQMFEIRPHFSMFALFHQLYKPLREVLSKYPSVIVLENWKKKGRKQIVSELQAGILGKI
ncbi:MAG TPA: hypothetical protein VN739_03080 [Nitrososphaerales archaeon]|nr:hypothetical protein [Nitrososphaerales archaeon]